MCGINVPNGVETKFVSKESEIPEIPIEEDIPEEQSSDSTADVPLQAGTCSYLRHMPNT
jgi:hypothetical protein